MERVLVTGAGGYIGTTLVPMLLAQGYQVRALDRFFFGAHLLPEHPRLERIRADIRRLDEGHLQGVDHVIDLAAISNDPSGELFPAATESGQPRRARALRHDGQGGRGPALPLALVVQRLRLPGPAGGL